MTRRDYKIVERFCPLLSAAVNDEKEPLKANALMAAHENDEPAEFADEWRAINHSDDGEAASCVCARILNAWCPSPVVKSPGWSMLKEISLSMSALAKIYASHGIERGAFEGTAFKWNHAACVEVLTHLKLRLWKYKPRRDVHTSELQAPGSI